MDVDPIEIEPDAWCDWCGDPLPEPEERHPRRKYCSRQCKDESRNAAAREAWAAALVEKDCPHCGTRFKQTRTCKVYCTPKCAANARYRRRTGRPEAITDRACLHCGGTFTPANLAQTYCNVRCMKLAHLARKG